MRVLFFAHFHEIQKNHYVLFFGDFVVLLCFQTYYGTENILAYLHQLVVIPRNNLVLAHLSIYLQMIDKLYARNTDQ